MYGAVRKSFPNCLDIVSYKMLELEILLHQDPSFENKKPKSTRQNTGKEFCGMLNVYFRFHLFIYFLRVCVCVFGCV